MQMHNKAVFSPDGEYFAFADRQGLLKIWDTSSNTLKIQHALLSSVNYSCSSLTWGPSNDKKSNQTNEIQPLEHQCLVIGTDTGEVLLYDLVAEKFCTHFAPAHSNAVTDLCWYPDTNSLFSCSKDKSIAIWDIVSGNLKSKWQADDEPIHAICVIDDKNMLSASTSILWWNIEEQTIIKKFSGHDSEILTLLPAISTEKASNSYFLSVATGDSKVNAWLLHAKNSINAVASFDLPDALVGIDVTRYFSKEKPMFLSAVMENGALLLFKHVLNGKTKKNLLPQSTLRVASKPTGETTKSSPIPIIASKFSNDSNYCVIAYGETNNPTFEKVNVLDCPKKLTLTRDKSMASNDSPKISQVKIYNKVGEFISCNGTFHSDNALHNSPKRRKQKDPDDNFDTNQNKAVPNSYTTSSDHQAVSNPPSNKKKLQKKVDKKKPSLKCPKIRKDIIFSDPSNVADNLVRGLQTDDRALLNMVLLCSDDELIRNSVALLPIDCLKSILLELQNRLSNEEERYIYSSRKWLKEILNHNLQHLRNSNDLKDILNQLKEFIDKQRVSDTLVKLTKLKGLLNLQRIQHRSVGFSDSSDEGELME